MFNDLQVPKDRVIIGKFQGYPFMVPCIWNECNKQWVYASLAVNMVSGKWNDPYFENEYFDEDDLVSWKELD